MLARNRRELAVLVPLASWVLLPIIMALTLAIPNPLGVWASLVVRNGLVLWLLLGALVFPWLTGAWRKMAAALLLGMAALVAMQAVVQTSSVAQWMSAQARNRALREPGNHTTELWRREGDGWRLASVLPTTMPMAEATKLSPANGVFFGAKPN